MAKKSDLAEVIKQLISARPGGVTAVARKARAPAQALRDFYRRGTIEQSILERVCKVLNLPTDVEALRDLVARDRDGQSVWL